MLSSAVQNFTDPDEYAAAIHPSIVELTVIERGNFNASQVRIDLHRLWVRRASESLARTADVELAPGRAYIAFPANAGPSIVYSGNHVQPRDIVRHNSGRTYYQKTSGPAHWAVMSLPTDDMVSLGAVIAGCDLTPPHDALVGTPSPSAMAKLQRLHAAAGHLAEDAPEIIAHPEAARGLEQALIDALVACLGDGEVRADRSALRQHASIMRRFRRAVEEDPDGPVYIPELCTAIGVSDRTLRACCQEQLGMSPKRYLLLRRMNLARRALRDSTPTGTTVTEIATRYGFWQFGRFAGEYKSLFGELPSATLGHPPE
jgi:AraC-like DNA-binding protein